MANKTSILIAVLVVVIVILAGIMVYAFVVKPKVAGYAIQKQNEGVQAAVSYIITQLQQNGFVQIPIGNQTLILVPYQPPQASQQAAMQTNTTSAK